MESQRFSNNALMLRTQLPSSSIAELANGLVKCKVILDADSIRAIESHCIREPSTDGEVTITLHLRFLHDEPDLRIETPAVPG